MESSRYLVTIEGLLSERKADSIPTTSPKSAPVESVQTAGECPEPTVAGRQLLGSSCCPFKQEVLTRKQFKPPARVERESPGNVILVIFLIVLQHVTNCLCINRPFTAKCNFSVWAKIAAYRRQFADFAFMSLIAFTLYYAPSSKVWSTNSVRICQKRSD